MKKIKFRDIEIHYENEDIDYILKIIENNYGFFKNIEILSFVENNSDKIFHINDIDEFLNSFSNYFFNNEKIKELKIPTLYLELLERNNNNNKFINLDTDIIEAIIAHKHYSSNEFIKYLKIRDNKKLYEWLENKYIKDVYKLLIDDMSDAITSSGFNTDTYKLITSIRKKKVNYDLSTTSKKEVYKLFYEFLEYINAPIEWKNTFTNIKDNDIYFFKLMNNINESSCFENKDGVLKIVISTNGDISCFPILVHEFMHYISLKKGIPPLTITEIPSMFFERISAEFLEEKGYKNINNYIVNRRINSNIKIYKDYKDIYQDIDNFVLKNKNYLELVQKLIREREIIINGYSYILDTFIVDRLLEEKDINNMITITDNLNNMNLSDFIDKKQVLTKNLK